MELRPDDATFVRMTKVLNVTRTQLMSALRKLHLFDNLTGKVMDEVFYTDSNEQFLIDMDRNLIDKSVIITKNLGNILHISGFPLTEEQRGLLETELHHPKQSEWNIWATLPSDVFIKMIRDNKIHGKDLIRVCVSNPKINEKCNAREGLLFKHLLLEEYGIQSYGHHRELYLEMLQTKVWTFGYAEGGRLGREPGSNVSIPTAIEGFEGINHTQKNGQEDEGLHHGQRHVLENLPRL